MPPARRQDGFNLDLNNDFLNRRGSGDARAITA